MRTAYQTDCERFHRRDFIKLGTAGFLGLSLADMLRLEAKATSADKPKQKAKSVIMVWLAGAPSTIDMWDLKPEAPENIRGEFKAIETSAKGLRICEHMPKVAKVMDQCSLVRSVNHNIPAHGPGTVYMTTGNKPTPAMEYPSLGSLASKLLPAPVGVPAFVTFSEGRAGGGNAGYLGSSYNPFEVEGNPDQGQLKVQGLALPDGFSLQDLANRDKLRAQFDQRFKDIDQADLPASLDKFHQQALDILRSDKTRKAFDLKQESDKTRETYGSNPFGQSALAARRLVEAGVRFVTIGLGGWDTHGANFRTLSGRLLPQLDKTLAMLISDLHEKGLLDSTVVYCAGEFARTPRINNLAGRDHWSRTMAVLLAGGGFKKGYAHGATDNQGMTVTSEACTPDDVSATLFRQLGLAPSHEVTTHSGRPIAIFREGKVIEGLIS
jgi:hypothetical protein